MSQNIDIIYTDGACSGNGKDSATGGFGVFFKKSAFSPNEIKINKQCVLKYVMYKDEKLKFPVTNIRMEGYAILTVLWAYTEKYVNQKNMTATDLADRLNSFRMKSLSTLKEKYTDGELVVRHAPCTDAPKIRIITDSQFWINVITKWLSGWSRKGIMSEKKNVDILLLLHYYTTILKQNGIEVEYVHVRSHQVGKRTEHADGNDVADVLATSSAQNINTKFTFI
jgi:ribonuclease HI